MSDAFFSKSIDGQASELLAKLQANRSPLAFSGSNTSSAQESAFSSELSGALNNLSEFENSDKVRDDSIRNAKAIIKNWQPPSDAQIDQILLKMRKELLA